jgi:poly-gamma-glutamate synthesis protein (capsule biosynthesis protein)
VDSKIDGEVRLVAVGDIQPNRSEPEQLFSRVAEELAWGDLRVAQLECVMSDLGTCRSDVRNPAHRVDPKNIDALTAVGFDLVSYAGNNNVDYGVEAMKDTMSRLHEKGIKTVGAGETLEEAVQPTVLTANGTKVAFVNFCSILRDGYAATPKRGGISPMRVSTFYRPLENIYEQPGTPAHTVTQLDEDDVERMRTSIAQARESADVVIACLHWGAHFIHDLTEYQPVLGYAAIDAGADLVIGTHPHCLQAIDVYKGKFILYSLGNFAFEQPGDIAQRGVAEYLSFYGIPVETSVPTHPHPRHCRMSAIAKVSISGGQVTQLNLVPTVYSDEAFPEVAQGVWRERIVALLQALCDELGTVVEDDGAELIVRPEKREPIDALALVRRRPMSYPWQQRLAVLGPDRYIHEVEVSR